MKIRDEKTAMDNNGWSSWKCQRGIWRKWGVRKKSFSKLTKKKGRSTLSYDGHQSSQERGVRDSKHHQNKGRIALRGDIVKDDSDAYATFTDQGSSASWIVAVKVMDVMTTLLNCTVQAVDAVSAYIRSHNVQIYVHVFHVTSGQNHDQTSKSQWFFSNGFCTNVLLQISCGKDNVKRFNWDSGGEKYRITNVYLLIK